MVDAGDRMDKSTIRTGTMKKNTIRTDLKSRLDLGVLQRGQLKWFDHVSRMRVDQYPRGSMEV